MEYKDFKDSFKRGCLRSKRILAMKACEYAEGDADRLTQFKKISTITNETPESVCIGLMAKHFSSICSMAFNPDNYSLTQWREKITDLRNYTHLLDALIDERKSKI